MPGIRTAPSREWLETISRLRRFGAALTRGLSSRDDESLPSILDRLCRQAMLTSRGIKPKDEASVRTAAFTQFLKLMRRRLRPLLEDPEGEAFPELRRRAATEVSFAIRSMPWELREAFLLVTLAGFGHSEAAIALDMPVNALVDRLLRARDFIERETQPAAPGPNRAPGVAHLRVVK